MMAAVPDMSSLQPHQETCGNAATSLDVMRLTRDLLCSVLSLLPVGTQCQAAAVSRDWLLAVEHLLGGTKELNLCRYSARICDDNMARLARRCPRVTDINLSGCRKIGDRGVHALASCKELRSLNLSCLPLITADAVVALCNALPIVSLELGGCARIGDAVLRTHFSQYVELDDDEDGLSKVQG
uniref:F-box/LRR-repeat protein 15-like leucin rich repeat domain-containing protein n=1 Tax=Chrysotila carterae TaxID=13221 RepID=A0A6S9ZD51_CHRCT